MAQVSLDGHLYDITGNIQRRNINPRAARFDTGAPGYASFTQASVNAYKGLRGGIGHKFQLGNDTEECYFSDGLDVTHAGSIILGPLVSTAGTFGAAPVKIIDFGGKTYAIGASKISEWSGTAWTSRETGIAAPLDAIVFTDSTDSYLVVTDATSAKYTTDGTNWSALTGPKGYLADHDNRLVSIYGQTLYYSPADNIDGTWDSCNVAGADMGTIHGLFTARSQNNDEPLLCINASNGLFTFDFWVNQVYPYLKLTGHTYAVMAGMFWNSYIWVSSLGGIKKISPGLVTDVGPDQDDGLPSTYQGYVNDMCPAGDGSWMVFSVHNGSATDKSSIFKRHGTVGGNQQIYSSAANTAITCLNYSPSHMYTNGRLWWGEGTSVKYCMFPDFNADPTQISSYTYVASSGKLVYSIFNPLSAFYKTAIRVRATTKGCTANLKWTVYYRTDANCHTAIGSNWTTLGTLTSSPSPTDLSFASGVGLAFKEIQFAVAGATNSSTSTPELVSLEFDYDTPTLPIRSWTFNIKVGNDSKTTIIDNLDTSQAKTTLLAFYPSGDSTNGTAHYVKIASIAENVEWHKLLRYGTLQVSVEELIRG